MMIGVAQVIGMNPTLSLAFSTLPAPCANASFAAASGKKVDSAAAAVPAPTAVRKRRRTLPSGMRARMTACSTSWSSVATISCSSCDRCTPQEQPAPSCGNSFERSSNTDMGTPSLKFGTFVLHQACQPTLRGNSALTTGFRTFAVPQIISAHQFNAGGGRSRLQLLVDPHRDRAHVLLAQVCPGHCIAAVAFDPIENADGVLARRAEGGFRVRRAPSADIEAPWPAA